MDKNFFLVQRIDSYYCERLNIENLYFGLSHDKAINIYQNEINTFIDKKYEGCTEEEIQENILRDVDETKSYWEYCDDDGDNTVIMIEELESV